MQYFPKLVLVFAFLNLSLLYAHPAPVPQSMSALGDSTSTATLAQYKRSHAMNPIHNARMIYDSLRFAFTGGNKFMFSDWSLSWTTGMGSKKVKSHAQRLKKLNSKLSVSNFAEPSARIDRVLSTQLPRLKAWSREAHKQNYPDYVTLMVGANDVCADSLVESTPVKKYTQNLKSILTEVLSSSPKTRVLVNYLPPLQDLTYSKDAFLWAFPGVNSCNAFWKVAPLCKSITHGDENNTLAVAARVQQMNQAISKTVNTLRKSYGDRVRVAHKVAQRRIHKRDLSIDCFHPNAEAQNDLAEISWASTWWVK